MGFRSIPRTFAYALPLIVLLIFIVSAQESGVEAESGDSSGSKDLNRRSKVLSTGLGRIVPNLISRKHTNRFCTPIFLESFILTFLAEWGDRSQIATIALATHKNALGVAVGATLGHHLHVCGCGGRELLRVFVPH